MPLIDRFAPDQRWTWAAALFLATMLGAGTASAQEFRTLRRIPAPPRAKAAGAASEPFRPVDEPAVLHALEDLLAAWNSPDLAGRLSARFFDAQRLAYALFSVPRDARARLLAVEAIRVIDQQAIRDPGDPQRVTLRSRVAVIARTQIEFEDPVEGFQRLEGTNEYVFLVTETVRE